MGSTQSYPRSEYWRLLRGWLHRNAMYVGLCLGVFLALVSFEVLLLLVLPSNELTRYLVVAVLAATAVGFCWTVHLAFLAHEGKALNQLRGSWGEDATVDALKRARRRAIIWDWVDGVAFEKGDIDHFVVTRNGGIVVIDSKWRSALSKTSAYELAESARAVARRGVGLVNTVTDRSSGRHRGARAAVSVTPVVAVWGAAQREIPAGGRTVEGVPIVKGSEICSWLASLSGHDMSEELALEITNAVRDFDQRRREALSTKVETSLVGDARAGRP